MKINSDLHTNYMYPETANALLVAVMFFSTVSTEFFGLKTAFDSIDNDSIHSGCMCVVQRIRYSHTVYTGIQGRCVYTVRKKVPL